ncbi:MAG: hypothetical protein PHN49_02465 [Candidatus Omnitrophica bacterium]|nr:hypothetical protein [Candidatus Omnitrophota bacterium]MDD5670482.1 hypothetical protein [Candidatus Omnitrophota bacterium]
MANKNKDQDKKKDSSKQDVKAKDAKAPDKMPGGSFIGSIIAGAHKSAAQQLLEQIEGGDRPQTTDQRPRTQDQKQGHGAGDMGQETRDEGKTQDQKQGHGAGDMGQGTRKTQDPGPKSQDQGKGSVTRRVGETATRGEEKRNAGEGEHNNPSLRAEGEAISDRDHHVAPGGAPRDDGKRDVEQETAVSYQQSASSLQPKADTSLESWDLGLGSGNKSTIQKEPLVEPMEKVLGEAWDGKTLPRMTPIAPKPAQIKKVSGWIYLALVLMYIAMTAAVGEYALRKSDLPMVQKIRWQQRMNFHMKGNNVWGLYTADPKTGWTLTPNFSKVLPAFDGSYLLETNLQGLRDRDYGAKPAKTFRILGLGDSFACGLGVHASETFYKLLEWKLNQTQVPSLPACPAGRPAFSVAGPMTQDRGEGQGTRDEGNVTRRVGETATRGEEKRVIASEAKQSQSEIATSPPPPVAGSRPKAGAGTRDDGHASPVSRAPFPVPLSQEGRNTKTRNYEVINAGIPGFGTYEELKLLKSNGLRYDPDLVVLQFNEASDYRRNGAEPRLRVIHGNYFIDVSLKKGLGLMRWLAKRSVLAAMLDRQWKKVADKLAFRSQFEETQQYLLHMKEILEQKGVPMVLMVVPDSGMAAYAHSRPARLFDKLLRGMDKIEARKELEAFCRANGIDYFTLAPVFEDSKMAGNMLLRKYEFNRIGHAIVARELTNFLQAGVLGK